MKIIICKLIKIGKCVGIWEVLDAYEFVLLSGFDAKYIWLMIGWLMLLLWKRSRLWVDFRKLADVRASKLGTYFSVIVVLVGIILWIFNTIIGLYRFAIGLINSILIDLQNSVERNITNLDNSNAIFFDVHRHQ